MSKRVRRRQWPLRLLCVGFCCLLPGAEAAAQGLLRMGKLDGFMAFGYAAERLKATSAGVPNFSFRRTRFDETLGFRGNAYMIAPSFVSVNYGTTFGFFQDRLTSFGEPAPGRGRLLGYDLGGTFFSEKDNTANLFANRSQTIQSRDFAGTSEILTKNLGTLVSLKSFFLPSTASFRNELSQEISRFGGPEGRREEQRRIINYNGRNHWEHHDLGLFYEFADVDDKVVPELSHLSNTTNLNHRFQFGGGKPKLLTTSLNHIQRSGERLGLSSLNLNENFFVPYTESLSSTYHYILTRFSGGGAETTSQTGLVSLQHQLYQSLTTRASLRGTRVGFFEGTQRIYTGRLDLNYQKRLPGNGTLQSRLGGLYESQDDQIQGRELPIFQERHSARIGIPLRLERLNALPETILVSGEAGTIIFREGLDYAVRILGDITEIDFLPTGRIREGETLLIDYRVSVSPSIKFSTRAAVFSVAADYGWIAPYYAFERNRQRLISGVDQGSLENLRSHTAGLRLELNGQKVSGFFTHEYRTQNARLLPFDSLQFAQFVSYTPRRWLTVGFNFDESFFRYFRPLRETGSGLGRLNIGFAPAPSFSVDGFYSLRLWKDTIATDEVFQQAGFRFHWARGKFSLIASLSRDLRTRGANESREWRWFSNVVRRF